MWPIIICAVIGAGIGAMSGYDPAIEWFVGAFLGAFVGFLVAVLVGAFVYSDTEWRPAPRVALVSMADGAGIEGHFFLGSGSVESTQIFTWYQQEGTNSYVRKSADAEVSTVHYLNSGRPYYVHSAKIYTTDKFMMPWGIGFGGSADEEHYDFYIPRGSIVQSYRLDNQ